VEDEYPGEQIGDIALPGEDEPEDEEIDQSEQEGIEHPPDQPQNGRCVSGFDVAPGQEPDEVPPPPKLGHVLVETAGVVRR
jgi:hypothetical protein